MIYVTHRQLSLPFMRKSSVLFPINYYAYVCIFGNETDKLN